MHLWPSLRLRDSFKYGYLKKLEWNLHRMNSEKKEQSESSTSNSSCDNRQKLLDDDTENGTSSFVKFSSICKELLLIFSCCYCCFCCGACVEGEESC